jgi:nitrogen regulatory protein P-II 1
MKEIKAIIQPFKLDAVLDALHQIPGLPGVTVSDALGISVQPDRYDHLKRTKLELMAPDAIVAAAVSAIERAAHTGNPGDGLIYVIDIEETVRIRTGQRET